MISTRFLARVACAALAVSLIGATSHSPTPRPRYRTVAPQLVIIRMDLDFRPHTRSTFGRLQGYNPAEVHVRMGDKIQWMNVDDEDHTATGMSYTGQTVPANYKFQGDFTKPHGHFIDASEWSTGNVRAHGGKSPVFLAKRVGHYFYGCGYHLGNHQIGVIVVGP